MPALTPGPRGPDRDGPIRLSIRDGPAQERSAVMAWIYLLIAGVLEVVWASGLHLSAAFSRPLH